MKYIEKNIISVSLSAFVLLIVLLSVFLNELNYKYLALSVLMGLVFIFVIVVFELIDLLYFFKNFHLFLIFVNFLLVIFLFSAVPIVFGIITGGIRTVAFIVLITFVLIFSDNNRKKYEFKRSFWENFSIFFLTISFFISTLIFNPGDYIDIYGGPALLTFIISPILLFYYFPRIILEESKIFKYFILLVFFIGFSGAVYGIITVIFPYANPLNTLIGYSISYFQHPNANAFLCAYTIPVTIYLYLKYKNSISNFKKVVLLFALMSMIINQMLTLSRTGNIAMIVCIFIFVIFYSRKLALILIATVPFVVYLIFELTNKGAGTVLGRIGLLFSALEMISSSKLGMLWGFGISSYSPIYETFKSSLWVSDEHNYPHNSIVYSILRFGLIHTFFLILYILPQITTALKGLILKRINLEYTMCISICVTTLFQSVFDDFILFPEYYLFHFFLVFFGLLVIYNKNFRNQRFNF